MFQPSELSFKLKQCILLTQQYYYFYIHKFCYQLKNIHEKIQEFLEQSEKIYPLEQSRHLIINGLNAAIFIEAMLPEPRKRIALSRAFFVVSIFVVPCALLLAIQISFLRYQSWAITIWHMTAGGFAVIFSFYTYRHTLNCSDVKTKQNNSLKIKKTYKLNIVSIVLFFYISFISHPPILNENPRNGWNSLFWQIPIDGILCETLDWGCRYINISNKIIVESKFEQNVISNYIDNSKKKNIDNAIVTTLDLSKRKFLYIIAHKSMFINVNFSNSDISHSDFRGSSFFETSFSKSIISHSKMDDTNLEKVNLSYTTAIETSFIRANLICANIRHSDLSFSTLYYARLIGANLYKVNLSGANCEGCQLQASDLWKANISALILKKANIDGAIFSEITDANITLKISNNNLFYQKKYLIYFLCPPSAILKSCNNTYTKNKNSILEHEIHIDSNIFEKIYPGNNLINKLNACAQELKCNHNVFNFQKETTYSNYELKKQSDYWIDIACRYPSTAHNISERATDDQENHFPEFRNIIIGIRNGKIEAPCESLRIAADNLPGWYFPD